MLYSAFHIGVMLLIMTMNGGVILFVIGGLTLGYFFFGYKDTDSNLPVNCCANSP